MFEVPIPGSLIAEPSLSSPLELQKGAGREVTYHPRVLGALDLDEPVYERIESKPGAGGREVGIIEHREDSADDPVQWFLMWELARGTLVTHVRGEDGPEAVDKTIALLDIDESIETNPIVLPSFPLRRAASAHPGYQESITFHAVDPDDVAHLTLTRPGSLREGFDLDGDAGHIRTAVGIDIDFGGIREDEMRELAARIVQQIADSPAKGG
jgi:hypothetical protein